MIVFDCKYSLEQSIAIRINYTLQAHGIFQWHINTQHAIETITVP